MEMGVHETRSRRLMRHADLRGIAAVTCSRLGLPIGPNRLARSFTVSAPSRVRLADPTYARTGEGWLAAIIDMFTCEIVGKPPVKAV